MKQPVRAHAVSVVNRPNRRRAHLLAAVAALSAGPAVHAATLTYDTAAAGSTVATGAGTWTTAASTVWTSDNGTTKTTWVEGSDANFVGTTGSTTVTLGTNITANSITIGDGTATLAIYSTGPVKTIDVPTITTGATGNSNIDLTAIITGNHGFTLNTNGTVANSQGRLNFKVAANYTGDTLFNGISYITTTSAGNDTLPATTALTFGGAGTYRFSVANQSQTVTGLSSTATGASVIGLTNTGNTFIVNTKASTSTSYAGLVTNSNVSVVNGLSFSVIGSGTQVLSNASSNYTGVTTVGGTATLSVNSLNNGGATSAIGAAPAAAANIVLNGGTLKYTGAAVSTNRLFSLQSSSAIDASGTGAVNFNGGGTIGFNGGTADKTLTLTGSNTGANTLGVSVTDNTGATGVTKTGAGSWTLSAANTYTGATTVSAGTLNVSGTGSLAGTNATVAASSTLALASGSTDTFTIGASGSVNGGATAGIGGTGNATLGGNFLFNLTGAATTTGSSWQIVDAAALSEIYSGTFAVTNAGAVNTAGVWSFSNAGTNYTFTQSTGVLAVAVPEPGVMTLLGVSSLAALRRRRTIG